ncbi:MAG: fumarylacetoacetate hydrolase family protein [Planctomycetes bacterium]|nr:fumarylacetoacetate hydrolase family protein [Planctomycetota bacterium]
MNPDLPPLAPAQVLAVGRNYAEHAAELGHEAPKAPLLFWKPIGSLVQGRCPLPRWPEGPTRIDYEGEIALVLDRHLGPGTPPLPDDPWRVVRAVAAAVDVSDRDLQKLEPQWVRAKGFHGACAVGEQAPRPADPEALRLDTWKNDVHVQSGRTAQLLFPFRDLLVYMHGFLRLFAGDVILTGTPAGVGPVAPGDRLRVVVGQDAPGAPLASLEVTFEEGPAVPPFRRGASGAPGL